MSTLVLRLAAPLQSWGVDSRFTERATNRAPTKSGIIGLLAAAQGRRRTDPIEDLLELVMATRIDQPGELLRDFHTAHHQVTGTPMPLSDRFYWSDAVFTAYVGGPQSLVEALRDAIQDPAFPLYLGRRACTPMFPLLLGCEPTDDVAHMVATTPWQASKRHQRSIKESSLSLSVQADASIYPTLAARRQLRDVPLSFSPERRDYSSRAVVDLMVRVSNPCAPVETADAGHDPFSALEVESWS